MSVTLEQIKNLRDRTGVSMTAVKKALEEANGDEEKAIEILRKKGEAKAVERSDRTTSNGVVAISQKSDKAAMVALACETDFVAKNDDFIQKAQALAEKVLKEGADADLSQELADLNIQMGEKVEMKDKKVIEGAVLGSYIHLNNKIGVVVALSGGDLETAKNIAMHIAASSPKTISPDDIASELIEKEKTIWTAQLVQEGKPADMIGKIMMGKEKKFREEWALLTQAFVKNPDQLVKDLLGSNSVVSFYRFEV